MKNIVVKYLVREFYVMDFNEPRAGFENDIFTNSLKLYYYSLKIKCKRGENFSHCKGFYW